MGDMHEIQMADRPWTRDRILILLNGEAKQLRRRPDHEWFEDVTGPTANDLRQSAYAGGPQSLLDDVIQLEMSVRTINDREVRNYLLLRIRTDCSPHMVAEALGAERSAEALEQRGVDLLMRDLRYRREQVRRVAGVDDTPVCWRCMRRYADRPGDLCRPDCNGGRMFESRASLRNTPLADRPDPATMTQAERDEEIAELVGRGEDNLVPGEWQRREREIPRPVIYPT